MRSARYFTASDAVFSSAAPSIDDVADVYPDDPNWDFELVQLQPGQLGFRVAERVLPGIWLSLETQACALRSCHARRGHGANVGASFGAILSDVPGHSWKGQPIGYGDVLVFGQASH
ncbi:MAG: hypothetical protein OIF47_13020, partial [Marinibacterium sp.]|nr:hypothetical protein [Marinibacterium sp.]